MKYSPSTIEVFIGFLGSLIERLGLQKQLLMRAHPPTPALRPSKYSGHGFVVEIPNFSAIGRNSEHGFQIAEPNFSSALDIRVPTY
jgi:hypothetical protein